MKTEKKVFFIDTYQLLSTVTKPNMPKLKIHPYSVLGVSELNSKLIMGHLNLTTYTIGKRTAIPGNQSKKQD